MVYKSISENTSANIFILLRFCSCDMSATVDKMDEGDEVINVTILHGKCCCLVGKLGCSIHQFSNLYTFKR